MPIIAGVNITMYRLGRRIKPHHWPYIIGSILVLGLIIGGVLESRQIFKANTVLTQSKPMTHYVASSESATQRITKSDFTIDLPTGWYEVRNSGEPSSEYSWQEAGNDISRRLDVYIDTIPANFAVNHLVPVQADGNHLDVIGSVSDNCANFTDKSTELTATGMAPAKWDGVSFICDMANYERDVVAIGSGQGVNTITLTGTKSGTHHVMLVYTDDSANADYSIFTSMVESFQVL